MLGKRAEHMIGEENLKAGLAAEQEKKADENEKYVQGERFPEHQILIR
jgi:hypothetical protein